MQVKIKHTSCFSKNNNKHNRSVSSIKSAHSSQRGCLNIVCPSTSDSKSAVNRKRKLRNFKLLPSNIPNHLLSKLQAPLQGTKLIHGNHEKLFRKVLSQRSSSTSKQKSSPSRSKLRSLSP